MTLKSNMVLVTACLCLCLSLPASAQQDPFGNCDPYEELRCTNEGVKWNKDTCTCGDESVPPVQPKPDEPVFGEFAYDATAKHIGFGQWYGTTYAVDNSYSQSPLFMNIANRYIRDHQSSVSLQLNGYSAGLVFDPHGYGLGANRSVFFGKIKLNPNDYNDVRQTIVVGIWDGGGFRYAYKSNEYVYPGTKDRLAITRRGDHYVFTWNQRQVFSFTDRGGRAGPVALMVGPVSRAGFENWQVRTNRR